MNEPNAGQDSTVVRVRGLRHRYAPGSRPAIDGVDLEIARGAFVALLGPNGSGKSTLLSMISTAMKPGEGSVEWWPLERPSLSTVRSRLGVVFQAPGLDDLLTVRENLRTATALCGLARMEADRRLSVLAERFELRDRLDHRVGTLSGGLRRRVDLARAMLSEPSLLLLDEPGTGLDLLARRAFLGLIASIRAERGLTVVMSTHLMDEAEEADRVVLMHSGRIAADDRPERLRSRVGPAVLRVAVDQAANADEIRSTLATFGAGVVEIVAPGGESAAEDDRRGWRTVVMNEDSRARTELISRLMEQGVPFEFGRPTLADAYLAITGAALEADAATVGGTTGRGRRRRHRGSHGRGTAAEATT